MGSWRFEGAYTNVIGAAHAGSQLMFEKKEKERNKDIDKEVNDVSGTPPMIRSNDVWIKNGIFDAIMQKCTPRMAADRLGIDKEVAVKAYKDVMLENSKPAVHANYGNVRVFIANSWGCYFIFHRELNTLLDNEKFDEHNFKCLPIHED